MKWMSCVAGKHQTAMLALLVILLLSVEPAPADSGQCSVKRQVTAQALDEQTWKQLNAIFGDIAAEQYDEAYGDLGKMLGRAGRDTYLQAIIYQALAQVEWSRKNYPAALDYFEKAVELNSLPDTAHFAMVYQAAQLDFMLERYDEALERLESWLCNSPADGARAAAYVLQASINVARADYAGALEAIEAAIAMASEPEEKWYQLQLAAQYELERYQEAAGTLDLMIGRWPGKKSYWAQLSQVYLLLNEDEKSLAVLALAYRRGLLDEEADILHLSDLYRHSEVPFKAADVLEKGISEGVVEWSQKHWTAAAESWYAADELERALIAYAEAGKAGGSGEIDLRRGFILVDLERWPEALDALDRALKKGGLNERQAGEAYLLRGMVQFNLGALDSAQADWGAAASHEKTRDAARQWINHLREERMRQSS